MSLIPTRRTVHYLDLGAPRYGLNILTAGHLSPEIRADIFISVIRELAAYRLYAAFREYTGTLAPIPYSAADGSEDRQRAIAQWRSRSSK